MKRPLKIALIGTKFMGKAHSHAWQGVSRFFDVPVRATLQVVCGTDPADTAAFAKRWEIPEHSLHWEEAVARKDIDIVDICAPPHLHHDMAVQAAKHGKHVFCEKPCAMNYRQALAMEAAVKTAGVVHYLNHNYRRVPAVAYARQLIDEGLIGDIYHWRGAYLQDWIMNPNFPLGWHLQKDRAGAGPHYDLQSHSVDLARYLVGEIESVYARMRTFIKTRPLAGKGTATFSAGTPSNQTGTVTVDDASFMVADFENGALGSFDSSRFAGGRKNYNTFEIYGSKGSLAFNLEQMNQLQYLDLQQPEALQGFRTISVTGRAHPYAGAWWGAGHNIGYEHTFYHAVYDFLCAIAAQKDIVPNMTDGVRNMQILEAALLSHETGRKVYLHEIE